VIGLAARGMLLVAVRQDRARTAPEACTPLG
jgi:hypothetical protein